MPDASWPPPYKVKIPSYSEIPVWVKAQDPEWRCCSAHFRAVGSSPHAFPRRSSHGQAHMDPSISRTSRQGIVIRVPQLSFITQYVNLQRDFSLQTATGFCTGQTKPWSSSYHMQIAKLKQMHFLQKGVFISDSWPFALTVTLAKSFWPCLIYIEISTDFFFFLLLVCVSFCLLHTCTCKISSSEATIPLGHLQVVSKCNVNCHVSTVCVILWHRNCSSASEFKEFRVKLWDHSFLFLEFHMLFLKTHWKAYSEAVNQEQMDSVCVFAQVWKALIS